MTTKRTWIRLHADWINSPSHRLCSWEALGFGALLMLLADRDPLWRENGWARVMDPRSEQPANTNYLAKLFKIEEEKIRELLAELSDAGTVKFENEILTFVNYSNFQETPDARRMRNSRASNSSRTVRELSPLTETETETDTETDTEEEKGKVSPLASKADTRTVLDWITDARRVRGWRANALKLTPDARAMVGRPLAQGYTLADWRLVIARSACDKAGKTWCKLATMHRPKNFDRLMADDDNDQRLARMLPGWMAWADQGSDKGDVPASMKTPSESKLERLRRERTAAYPWAAEFLDLHHDDGTAVPGALQSNAQLRALWRSRGVRLDLLGEPESAKDEAGAMDIWIAGGGRFGSKEGSEQ